MFYTEYLFLFQYDRRCCIALCLICAKNKTAYCFYYISTNIVTYMTKKVVYCFERGRNYI